MKKYSKVDNYLEKGEKLKKTVKTFVALSFEKILKFIANLGGQQYCFICTK